MQYQHFCDHTGCSQVFPAKIFFEHLRQHWNDAAEGLNEEVEEKNRLFVLKNVQFSVVGIVVLKHVERKKKISKHQQRTYSVVFTSLD